MKRFFSILILLFVGLWSKAMTYYVSPSGNDSNDGMSSATAFKTLQHASDVVMPGDSVSVLPGTYSGFYHTTSGMASQRIVFAAQPGVIINQPNVTTDDGINLEGASYITIEGFTVADVPRTGIRAVDDTGVIIRNNMCDHCGVWGILTGFSENILIEGNICTNTVEQHGIYFGNSADNPVIRNNTCYGNHDCGIHMNGDVSLGGDGIISNALVENNIIHDNGTGGGSAINCDGVQNSRIQNNLLYNNHASGIALFRIDAGGGASNNVVVNNTILQAADARWGLLIDGGSTGNIVFNNIIWSDHAFRGSIAIDAASISGFHSNYNIVTDRMSTDDGNTVITLAQWQQATQSDSSSFIAIPDEIFQDVDEDNYHPNCWIDAYNRGVDSYYSKAAPAFDLEGTGRPYLLMDIGCYEIICEGVEHHSSNAISWNDLFETDAIWLIDPAGRKIFTGKKYALDEHSLAGGVYFFRALHNNSFFTGETLITGIKH